MECNDEEISAYFIESIKINDDFGEAGEKSNSVAADTYYFGNFSKINENIAAVCDGSDHRSIGRPFDAVDAGLPTHCYYFFRLF